MTSFSSDSAPSRRQGLRLAVGEFLRFLPVGGSAATISLLAYSLLLTVGLHTVPAKAIGFAAGAGFSFFGNRRFSFRREAGGLDRIVLFCLLYLASLVLNVFINETVLHFLASRSVLSLAAGWLVATACSASANFIGMKLLVFRGQRKGEPHQTRGADPSSDG